MRHKQSTPKRPIIRITGSNGPYERFGWQCPICYFYTGTLYGYRADALYYARRHMRYEH